MGSPFTNNRNSKYVGVRFRRGASTFEVISSTYSGDVLVRNLATGHIEGMSYYKVQKVCSGLADVRQKLVLGVGRYFKSDTAHPLFQRWRNLVSFCHGKGAVLDAKSGNSRPSLCEEWKDFSTYVGEVRQLSGYDCDESSKVMRLAYGEKEYSKDTCYFEFPTSLRTARLFAVNLLGVTRVHRSIKEVTKTYHLSGTSVNSCIKGERLHVRNIRISPSKSLCESLEKNSPYLVYNIHLGFVEAIFGIVVEEVECSGDVVTYFDSEGNVSGYRVPVRRWISDGGSCVVGEFRVHREDGLVSFWKDRYVRDRLNENPCFGGVALFDGAGDFVGASLSVAGIGKEKDITIDAAVCC